MNQRVIASYFPALAPNEGVELGRFVLDDSLAANAETWALARMRLGCCGRRAARTWGIVQIRDPIERRDECGELVKRGHVGTIYKAGNAQYRGRSSARMLWLSPSGASFADRTLGQGAARRDGRALCPGAPGRDGCAQAMHGGGRRRIHLAPSG